MSPRLAARALGRIAPLWRLERRARRLDLLGRPGFTARSRRLRARVLVRLDPAFDRRASLPTALPFLVRERLREAAAPIRRFLRVLLFASCGALTLFALVIGAACALSPEVRAHFFPPNVAAGARWQLSSTYPGMPASGVGPSGPGPLFFHTLEENDASIVLTFPRPIVPKRIRIRNREECCQERALPLNVESLGPEGERLLCQRRAPFSTWDCHPYPVSTTQIRIRHPVPGILHLAGIEVYE